ncbi:MAG: HPr family phosphocarrier protein [Sphaerochaetaceae bacterium]|nr:HPr family phosphocarrier protein [Sphaerochaetaceae bacterium]MDC7237496.1 HPr family phosphocarrier protein [Sphaerochaetaceae bacterium]
MVSKILTVRNRAGIHARPAAMIVKVANKFKSELYMEKDDIKINGKSIMGVITLGAGFKSEIKISCEGDDEVDMANAIEKLFENRFEQ